MKWAIGTYDLVLAAVCADTAVAHGLNQRQASSTSLSKTSSSSLAAATSSSKFAEAAATPSGTASKTTPDSSSTASPATDNSTSSIASDLTRYITIIPSPPPFTATTSSAYEAHGVNATFNSTFTHPSTASTGTATKLPPGAVLEWPPPPAGPLPTGAQIGDIPDDMIACRINGSDHKQGPFCTPEYNQHLWVNNIYASTWNPDLFAPNATNYIEIHNTNSTSDPLIYNSTVVANTMGYMNIYMNHSFLGSHSGNYTADGMNLSFILFSTPVGGPTNRTMGPNTTLIFNPADLPKIKWKNPIPAKKGLEIGLPIGLVAFVVIALSIWCGMRKHRRNWNEMRHYGQDYMWKRRGKGKGKAGQGIELNDYDFDANTRAERFEDEPTTGRGGNRNQFRDELERQRQEEFRNRAAKVSSGI